MKKIAFLAVLLTAAVSFAATSFDGTYQFQSRMKKGTADMTGWTGTMTIQNDTITRNYQSTDGTEKKFYTGSLTPSTSPFYLVKYTAAYKTEYVGMELKSKFTLSGNTLTITSEDGQFIETWVKK